MLASWTTEEKPQTDGDDDELQQKHSECFTKEQKSALNKRSSL